MDGSKTAAVAHLYSSGHPLVALKHLLQYWCLLK